MLGQLWTGQAVRHAGTAETVTDSWLAYQVCAARTIMHAPRQNKEHTRQAEAFPSTRHT
jgi:hypothetical protein